MTTTAPPTDLEIATADAASRLKYLEAKRIIVVDDAFDRPGLDELEEELPNFIEQVKLSAEVKKALNEVAQVELKETSPLSDDLIEKLWKIKWEETPLAEICRTTIFADSVDKLSNVKPFCDYLQKRGFQVVEIGQAGEIPRDNVALVLVDYVLGHEAKPTNEEEALELRAQAIATSEAVVKKFYHSFPKDADKPFIVLMSSRHKADVLLDQFEKNSDLLRGMFDFVTKSELCQPTTLEFKLRTWNFALPARHHIQHFAEAIFGTMDDVGTRFREAVRQLSFQDYTYIQSLALQDDGHPLGDYMLWLYSSFLGDLLQAQSSVIKQREKLDAMEFPAVLPTEDPPSAQLAELYQTAISSPSDPLNLHPREGNIEPGEPSPVPPAQLGDVFVKDGEDQIYMVLNAACDLAFAPHTSRTCDLDQAIMLIPGRLTPLYEAPSDMKLPRTELFAHEKKLFRVIWRDDRVVSIPYKDLFSRMKQSGHERRYRLRLPYALLVQQAFASRLTRVGLPVAPPICVAVDVHAHCIDDAGNGRAVCAPVKGGAFVIHRKQKNEFIQEFVLTAKCAHMIVDQLDDIAEQQTRVPLAPIPPIKKADGTVDAERQAAAEAKQHERLKKKKDQILGYKKAFDFWFSLVTRPRALPQLGQSITLADGVLNLYRGATFDGAWDKRPFIALNLQYGLAEVPHPLPGAAAPSAGTVPSSFEATILQDQQGEAAAPPPADCIENIAEPGVQEHNATAGTSAPPGEASITPKQTPDGGER
jgi:hypothetical protein